MVVKILAGELTTGKILAEVPTTDDTGSWSTVLNGPGEVKATIPLRSMEAETRRSLLSYVEGDRCFLAAVTDAGHVLEAGPVWQHQYTDTDGHLTATANGLASIFDHRTALPAPPWPGGVAAQVLSWSSLSLGTIAKRLVSATLSQPGGDLPIVLPADVAGAHERTYKGYELSTYVGERLQQLIEVEGGPDLAFQPRITTDGLSVEWVLRTGTDADPLLHQIGDDHRWDRGAVRGELRLVSVDSDASQVAYRVFVTGDGMEEDLPVELAEDLTPTDVGYPLLERVESSNATETTTLDAYAAAVLDSARRPWQTWALQTGITAPPLGTYRPGDWASVHIPEGHTYLRAGVYRTRITEIAGSKGTVVNLKLAPTMEGR